MSVKKVSGGYATVHCHGRRKGKVIHKFKTKKEALAQHKAIEANKEKDSVSAATDRVFRKARSKTRKRGR